MGDNQTVRKSLERPGRIENVPWKDTRVVMDKKLAFWAEYQRGEFSMTQLCAAFEISRQAGYELLAKVRAEGVDGFKPHSRAPHHHPNATRPEIVAAVLRARNKHPSWGPRKLFPGDDEPPLVAGNWPAPSTIGDILTAAGLTKRRKRARQTPPYTQPLGHALGPNDLLCCDFKGWCRARDGRRCDPLTMTDAYSRMVLRCQLVEQQTEACVRPVFESCFREFGLPRAIRSDNGPPFASVGAGGLSRLSVWWVKLGIVPERIAPGHPEQNGRHERFHRTLKAETMQPPAATWHEQQQRFTRFVREFNEERPHEALGQEPPASYYQPSPRPYLGTLREVPYPDDAALRRVRSNGEIKWRGHTIFIAEPLVREVVGVQESASGFGVYFGPIFLGTLDLAHDRLVKPARPGRGGVTGAPATPPRPAMGP